MEFKGGAATLLVVLLSGSWASGGSRERNPELTILVQDSAGISEALVKHAEFEASRIFRAAGIDTRWIDCSRVHECHHVPGANEFVLNVIGDGRTSTDLVFGVAFLGPDGRGKYGDVFFQRMQRAYATNGRNISRLLGTVAAHELGHLLLGSHSHTNTGVMTAEWKEETLRCVEMGSLLFTREQAAIMRSRIGGEQMLLAGGAGGAK